MSALFALFIVCTLLAAIAAALHFTTRPRWTGTSLIVSLIATVTVAGVAYSVHRETQRELATPVAVVKQSTALREGNGPSYPVSLTLPPGTEVTVLHRRGAWVRVELAGVRRGWLPDACLLMPTTAP